MCVTQCASCRNSGTSCLKNFRVDDTVEVLAASAFKGEVGKVIESSVYGVTVKFPDGMAADFHSQELRNSQHKLLT